jgi:hypothetical protein
MDAAGTLSADDLMSLIRTGPTQAGAPGDAAVAAERDEGGAAPGPEEERAATIATGQSPRGASVTRGLAAEGSVQNRASAAHDALLERFRAHMLCEFERGRFTSKGPVKGYPRAVRRFLEYVASTGARPDALREELLVLAPRYLEALRSGRHEAPDSEPLVARPALRELTRFLAAG